MFRNSLFLKIVIIFTIPVMGILLFSSFMVYEKINIIEDLKHNELRLDYIKNSEKLIISLKQEKMISLEQLSNNNKLKILSEQQDKTKLIVNNFFATVDALSWKNKWKDQEKYSPPPPLICFGFLFVLKKKIVTNFFRSLTRFDKNEIIFDLRTHLHESSSLQNAS